jgi:hypothetical protein
VRLPTLLSNAARQINNFYPTKESYEHSKQQSERQRMHIGQERRMLLRRTK